MLFVDLVKAFDIIVHDIAVGLPNEAHNPREDLASPGLDARQIELVIGFGILLRLRACPLHGGDVGDGCTVVVCPRGLSTHRHARLWVFCYRTRAEIIITCFSGVVAAPLRCACKCAFSKVHADLGCCLHESGEAYLWRSAGRQ